MTRILFLGNSYLHRGPVPLLLHELAQRHGRGCLVYQSAPEAATLNTHLMSDEVEFVMRHGRWDVLVLQEHSTRLLRRLGDPEASWQDAAHLTSLFRRHNPQGALCLLQTWARHPSHRFGSEGFYPGQVASPEAMLSEVQRGVEGAREAVQRAHPGLSISVAPAGEAWQRVSQRSGAALHDSDGSHANPLGQWLTALVLYRALFGEAEPQRLPAELQQMSLLDTVLGGT